MTSERLQGDDSRHVSPWKWMGESSESDEQKTQYFDSSLYIVIT